jgi:MFS family permease
MLQKILYRFLERRHFWRYVGFDEVAELYAARLLRMTATGLMSTFAAVYLLRSGYSLVFICVFYTIYFLLKAGVMFPAAQYVARFGPKHAMLLANILNIPAVVAFSLLPMYGVYALAVYCIFLAPSVSMYGLAHNVSFSKVKSAHNAGKEISFMSMMDKVASGLSPLLGGIIAWLISPQATMWVAALLYIVAALPLFRSAEPVMTRQKISFTGFPWHMAWRSLRSDFAIGFDYGASQFLWPLFLTVFVFASSGSEIYAQIGGLATITLVIGFIAARTYGILIDRRRGRELLQYATYANTVVHLIRPFTGTPFSAALVNGCNEAATIGYSMAFIRGMFDIADETGHRIAYLLMMEAIYNIGAALLFAIVGVIFIYASQYTAFTSGFILTGIATLIIARTNFPIYRR